MNTEITDKEKFEGWLLYDADCRLCVSTTRRFRNLLATRRIKLLPLQTPWVRARLGLTEPELMAEMWLLESSGSRFGGADALLEISRHFWWAWPFRQLGRIPMMKHLFRAGYRRIARNRNCASNTCKVEPRETCMPNAKRKKARSGKKIVFFEMP